MLVIRNRFLELLAIKSRTEGRRISQREVADDAGVSLSTISSYATQKVTRYDADVIAALCNYFDCQPGDLLIAQLENDEKIAVPA